MNRFLQSLIMAGFILAACSGGGSAPSGRVPSPSWTPIDPRIESYCDQFGNRVYRSSVYGGYSVAVVKGCD